METQSPDFESIKQISPYQADGCKKSETKEIDRIRMIQLLVQHLKTLYGNKD